MKMSFLPYSGDPQQDGGKAARQQKIQLGEYIYEFQNQSLILTTNQEG